MSSAVSFQSNFHSSQTTNSMFIMLWFGILFVRKAKCHATYEFRNHWSRHLEIRLRIDVKCVSSSSMHRSTACQMLATATLGLPRQVGGFTRCLSFEFLIQRQWRMVRWWTGTMSERFSSLRMSFVSFSWRHLVNTILVAAIRWMEIVIFSLFSTPARSGWETIPHTRFFVASKEPKWVELIRESQISSKCWSNVWRSYSLCLHFVTIRCAQRIEWQWNRFQFYSKSERKWQSTQQHCDDVEQVRTMCQCDNRIIRICIIAVGCASVELLLLIFKFYDLSRSSHLRAINWHIVVEQKWNWYARTRTKIVNCVRVQMRTHGIKVCNWKRLSWVESVCR